MMKKDTLRHVLAALAALSLLGSAVPFAGTASAAATKDISDTMTWGTLRIGGGGFVSGIVTGTKNMYARTDVGGAYRYNYETECWEQLFGFISDADRGMLSVDAMAVDPKDDNIVYFLCGCAYFSNAETRIYKTTDGGKTFTFADVTEHIQVFGNGNGRQCGESIAVDPDNPNVIYAGGDVSKDKTGLIKSTDGGKTWKPVEGFTSLNLFKNPLAWPWWEKETIRYGVIEDSGEAGYVKHNGIGAIAVTGGKVYVSIAAKGTNMYVADAKDDKFAPLKADLPTTFVPSRINVDPNGDLLISYMAGINFEGTDGAGYRYSPKTGKTTMLLDSQGLGSVWADPENPDHLLTSTCGKWQDQEWQEWTEEHGPCWGDQYFRSFDGGKTWENFTPGKTKGWNQPLISNYLQDGGYDWIRDKAIHWSGTVVTDPRDHNKMWITSGNGIFVCTNLWSQDDDNLPTFTFHPDGVEEVVSLDFTSTPDGLNLSAIGDYDGFVHNDANTIPPQYQPNMGSTSAIAVCPQDTNVWARTANGDGNNTGSAYYTLDRGKTWTAFTPAATGGKLSITMLSKGKYRILNSSASGGVSYTDDFGKTWSKCEGISASKTVYTLVDPEDPSIVYASGVQHNDYWASDMTKTEPTLEESHYGFFISKDYGKTFTGQTICRYDMCDSTGDPAYITKDTIAMAAGWYGMYILTDSATKATKLDSVFYAKTVGYGAPEKSGGINTLYMYGKPQESDPEGIYRSTDAGKTWVCINTDHLYGGTGNGNYLCGDMSTFGKVYMSTVGCGIVYGEIAGTAKPPVTTVTTATTKQTTTTTTATTAKTSASSSSGTKQDKTTVTGAKDILWGDANCDKVVDVSDAVLVARFAAEDTDAVITADGKRNADVTHNSNIDSDDTLRILRYISKLITYADLEPKK